MLGPDGKPLKGPNGEYLYPPPYGAPPGEGGIPGAVPIGQPGHTPGGAKHGECILKYMKDGSFSLNNFVHVHLTRTMAKPQFQLEWYIQLRINKWQKDVSFPKAVK